MMITASPSSQSPITGMTPEINVLLYCARIHTTPTTANQISSLLKQPFNWDYLIDLAKFHKVIPLLYKTLNDVCPKVVPQKTLRQLKTLVHSNTCQNLFLIQEFLRISKLLERNGIPSISFKGPTLAISAYGSLSLRQIGDLDLLLPKNAMNSAQELLIAEGYQLSGNYDWEFHFTRIDGHVHIDLHQEIAPKFYKLPFNFDSLFSRAKPISLGGTSLLHLLPEDLLLLLSLLWFRDCTYLNSHFSLHLLCDVDAILHQHSALNWPWIVNQANHQGYERILKLMLLSTQKLLGTVLPQTALDTIQSDPVLPSLSQSVESRLFRAPNDLHLLSDNPGFWESIWTYDHSFYLKCRERLRDRFFYCLSWLQMCIHLAFTPNEGDFHTFALPNSLFLLYYPLHLIRLFIKYSRKLLDK